MLTAVEFDHQLCRVADEVGDVIIDGYLTAKGCAVQAIAAQLRPEDALRISQVTSERTRICAQSSGYLPVRMFRIDHEQPRC
ncbi:hypothetical protein BLN97_02625 [Bradyrhizobium elkanii]|nr:hypothetical protein BLN97_02625 [Bradyrhizobium elkanii]